MPVSTVLLAVLATSAPAPEVVVRGLDRHFAAPPLAERELAMMRGGLRLPNGFDISLGIDIQTRVDGLLALHTVYASEGSQPGIRVFTDGAAPVPLAPTTQTIVAGTQTTAPILTVDRSPTGTTILPSTATPATTVNLVNGDPATWLSGQGQTQLPVTPNGPPVQTAQGQVSLTSDDSGAVVALQSPTLDVRQMIGQATGIVIANTASDRTIDTVSSVNVDVQGLTPALSAGIFMAERAALDAVVTGH